MPGVGVLILFAIVAALISARRHGGAAILFAAIAVVLFVATPAGRGLPGAVEGFLSTFDHAATPALDQQQSGGAG